MSFEAEHTIVHDQENLRATQQAAKGNDKRVCIGDRQNS